jgi:1-hydroxycarotenoid 3,4-desaturase
MTEREVVVVGGGVGGLVTAIELARGGARVTLLERGSAVGGKMRTVSVEGRPIDVGPTVLTMRWVFDEIFRAAGASLEEFVSLSRADVLARHAWVDTPGQTLDLFHDAEKSADAIGAFAGPREARGYLAFVEHARRVFETVEEPFMLAEKPSIGSALSLAGRLGTSVFSRIDAHRTMHKSLGDFFRDPRLVQLFGRYATYTGSSPFLAPATLNVVAHVEREGVWLVRGGMIELGRALAALAARLGVEIRTNAEVSRIRVASDRVQGVELASGEVLEAKAVVHNGDVGALSSGILGAEVRRAAPAPSDRSLSAMTFACVAETSGFALDRHNVVFSSRYEREFDELFSEGRVPREPTVYVCAQDRGLGDPTPSRERLFLLVNAPADGDRHVYTPQEIRECEARTKTQLSRIGLRLCESSETVVSTPSDFARAFPATGGALYGAATHGMSASFARSGSSTKIRGLFLSGGSVHPGAGVPMVALSGRLAAKKVAADLDSTSRFARTGTLGGIWT